jgi:phosphoribosylformylglycinamidine cyclo-ligase
VGFCLIVNKKKINKIKKYFTNEYQPYEIGFISKENNKINLFNKIKW